MSGGRPAAWPGLKQGRAPHPPSRGHGHRDQHCVGGGVLAGRRGAPSPLPLRAELGSPKPRSAKTAIDRQEQGGPGGAPLTPGVGRLAPELGEDAFLRLTPPHLWCFVRAAPGPSRGAPQPPLRRNATALTGRPGRPASRPQRLCGHPHLAASRRETCPELLPRAPRLYPGGPDGEIVADELVEEVIGKCPHLCSV